MSIRQRLFSTSVNVGSCQQSNSYCSHIFIVSLRLSRLLCMSRMSRHNGIHHNNIRALNPGIVVFVAFCSSATRAQSSFDMHTTDEDDQRFSETFGNVLCARPWYKMRYPSIPKQWQNVFIMGSGSLDGEANARMSLIELVPSRTHTPTMQSMYDVCPPCIPVVS